MVRKLNEDAKKLEEEIANLKKAIKAIINSPEFISLFGKTQFLDSDIIKGLIQPEDRKEDSEWTTRRTRGDHSISVAAIAAKLVEDVYMDTFGYEKRLKKTIKNESGKNVEVESIVLRRELSKLEEEAYHIYSLNKQKAILQALLAGYSHDLGHTPFGHDGELAICKAFNEYQDDIESSDEKKKMASVRRELFGNEYEENLGHPKNYDGAVSFEHTEQSYINFLNIITRNQVEGFNLEVIRMAILAHSRSRVKTIPNSIKNSDRLVVHAIRTADKVDYQYGDAYEIFKLINSDSLDWEGISEKHINSEVDTITKMSDFTEEWGREIVQARDVTDKFRTIRELGEFRKVYELWPIVYCELNQEDIEKIGTDILIEDINNKGTTSNSKVPNGIVGMFKGNKSRNFCLTKKLMKYYFEHYEEIPDEISQKVGIEAGIVQGTNMEEYKAFDKKEWEEIGYPKELITIGFISSLTNEGARKLYEDLVGLRIKKGYGYGIEPITIQEINEVNRMYTTDYIKRVYKDLVKDLDLNTEEMKNIERRLRVILSENKEMLRKIITGEGMLVSEMTEELRSIDLHRDAELARLVAEADGERETTNILNFKFPSNSSGDSR